MSVSHDLEYRASVVLNGLCRRGTLRTDSQSMDVNVAAKIKETLYMEHVVRRTEVCIAIRLRSRLFGAHCSS